MDYSNKRECQILGVAILFLLLILGSYAFNPILIYLALPCVLYVAYKSTSPIDVLIPLAIIVTWGAEVWNTTVPVLYTIIRLLVVLLFLIKAIFSYSKFKYVNFFLPLLLFVIYNLLNESLNYSEVLSYMFYVNIIICYTVIYFVSRYSTIEDFEGFSFAIGVGVLFSAIIALVSPFIPSLLSIVVEMIQTDNSFGGDVIENRFSSLAYDPNLFGMYVDCALSLNLIVLIRRQFKHSFLRLLLCCCLVVVGVMTLSKSYFLVTTLLFLYSFVQIFKSKQIKVQRKLIITIICLIIGVVLAYYFADYFAALFSRFDSKKASDLTTGRSDLAIYYLNYLFDNPGVLLFGNTLLGNFKNYSYPHNFAIYLLFFFGIVGTIIFIRHIINIITLNKKYRFVKYTYFRNRNLHYIPLGTYLLYSFTIDPFALYDVKMILLAASFTAWLPLVRRDQHYG